MSLQADRWYYIDDGPLFETLPHLVDHYIKHMDGLPVLLMEPIPPTHNVRPPVSVPPPRQALPTVPVSSKPSPAGGRPKPPPPRPSLKRVSCAASITSFLNQDLLSVCNSFRYRFIFCKKKLRRNKLYACIRQGIKGKRYSRPAILNFRF